MSIKKMTSLVLTLLLVLAMAVPAFAAEPGKITIKDNTTTNADADSRKFIAYQILTVTLAADNTPSYAVPAALKDWYETYFFGPAPGAFSGKSDAEVNSMVIGKIDAFKISASAMEKFAKDALAEASKAATLIYKTAEFSGGAEKDVPYGYYVIEQTEPTTHADGQVVSAVMVDTTMPSVEIEVKADTHEITKAIVTEDVPGTKVDADSDDASIGDTVSYKVATKVPVMTGYTQYVFQIQDTLSPGLTFANNVKVMMGTKELTAGTDYTVWQDPDNAQVIKIIFLDFIDWRDADPSVIGQDIVVTYDAIVNDNAAIGVKGNPNEVKLLYSNDPSYSGDGDPDDPKTTVPHGETPEAKTRTFATGIDLTKVDAEDNPLVGAEFVLKGNTVNQVVVYQEVFEKDISAGTYWKLKDGTYTTTDPATPGMDIDKYEEPTTDKYSIETLRTVDEKTGTYDITAMVGADGVLRLDGLSAGQYTLTETKAPNGYNILLDSIYLDISVTLPDDDTTDAIWAATMKIGTASEAPSTPVTITEGRLTFDVVNNKGTELPSTGGIGTTLFTIGGIALIGVAVLLLVLRKKQSKA